MAKKERARRSKREKKSPASQAGEFVREEIHRIRRGEHGARSPEQAIAIGLSKARRAGVKLSPPKSGRVSEKSRRKMEYDTEVGQEQRRPRRQPKVSRAVTAVLEREPRTSASRAALSRHSRQAAARRTPAQRSEAARKAARTKGAAGRSAAARKAAKTRARNKGR